jgi:hypothetical protein
MNASDKNSTDQISNMLGLYKAEWLNDKLFELFSEPGYFGDLKTSRPCVLIGGRGTGKTTVLRGLSYEGQFALCDQDRKLVEEWSFYGLYYRVNTNRVTAFRGPELTEEKWSAHFAHYINLTFCCLLLEFVSWFELQTGKSLEVDQTILRKFQTTIGLKGFSSLGALAEELEYLVVDFEASINSISDNSSLKLSMQAAPIDALVEVLLSAPQLRGKQFFFLIDEFENFEDYQQRVLNTIIKHASSTYTFKVGVRELGWRQRATLNPNEQLTSPADYAKIHIGEVLDAPRFKTFAERVITSRIGVGGVETMQPQIMFPPLSEIDEADLLLDRKEVEELREKITLTLPEQDRKSVAALRAGEIYFLDYWTRSRGINLSIAALEYSAGSKEWKTRFDNHFYAAMFAIKRGKRGIRKYYSGWDVYLALADGNIRYLLELVDAAFKLHQQANEDGGLGPISSKIQTQAAELVGKKNLSELEGLSVEGARLTKLLLSLGRVFQVLAASPEGHTPEANQFHIRQDNSNTELDETVKRLLDHAVMHLALVRFPGNKPMDDADTREYDYMIHPIFAPLFVFSHRRKRQLMLESTELLGLIQRPREVIKEVLTRNNRTDEEDLPDQLQLFGGYYAGN